jgi:ABC-2 type transport system permease protein
MFRRIKPIIVKECWQVLRDRGTLATILLLPALVLVLFGYALNFDVKHLPLAVLDESRTPASRALVQALDQSEYFDQVMTLDGPSKILPGMQREAFTVALVIPPDFADRLRTGNPSPVQLIVDGSNSNTGTTVVGYLNGFVQDFNARLQARILLRNGSRMNPTALDFRPRIWYNPELKSTRFLIPGLMGFILAIITVISTALSLVREKERNTIEQILVSPVTSVQLILGKLLPYVGLALIAAAIVVASGSLLFDVPMRGSYGLLLLATLLFIVAGLGQGLLISSISDTQQTAFLIAAFSTLLPTFILSGFVFPIEGMPRPLQLITYLIPARHYLNALREIMLKGTGLAVFWDDVVWLVGLGVLFIAIAALRMRNKTL